MVEWGLVFSLRWNKWAALPWSHPLARKYGSVLFFLSLSPLCTFYFILFCLFILFWFWQGVKWSDSPTLLDSASGHKWATGFLGALLIQLGQFQNPPVTSGKWSCHQLSVRAEEILPPALFPFSLWSIFFCCWRTFSRVVKTLLQHLLALDLKSLKILLI